MPDTRVHVVEKKKESKRAASKKQPHEAETEECEEKMQGFPGCIYERDRE